jgi:hypothetical protein
MPDFDLRDHAAWIAEQIGWSTFDAQSSHNHVLVRTENGVEMKLWLSVESGRLKVSADSLGLYEFAWREERFPAITCSLEKTPAQVARDIERRVLPEYKALLEKLLVRKAAHDERKRKQHECCQQIADILRTEMREGQGRDSDPRVYCYGKGTSSIEFIVMSDTTVKIEIRGAAFEAAMQIAHTTQEWLRYGWTMDNEQYKLEDETT